jgi:hypothetical protein
MVVCQMFYPPFCGYANFCADLLGFGRTNAVDIGQSDQDPLLGRDIDAGNTRHWVLSSVRNDLEILGALHRSGAGAGQRGGGL